MHPAYAAGADQSYPDDLQTMVGSHLGIPSLFGTEFGTSLSFARLPALGMYTRLTGRGRHDEAPRCTCTASSILAWGVNATCPSTPAVLWPASRCIACRTLISVLL
jgi:hypothetical protein